MGGSTRASSAAFSATERVRTTARTASSMGGTGAILRSVALDVPLSTLAAPAIALTQTIDLIGITRQRRAEWPESRPATR